MAGPAGVAAICGGSIRITCKISSDKPPNTPFARIFSHRCSPTRATRSSHPAARAEIGARTSHNPQFPFSPDGLPIREEAVPPLNPVLMMVPISGAVDVQNLEKMLPHGGPGDIRDRAPVRRSRAGDYRPCPAHIGAFYRVAVHRCDIGDQCYHKEVPGRDRVCDGGARSEKGMDRKCRPGDRLGFAGQRSEPLPGASGRETGKRVLSCCSPFDSRNVAGLSGNTARFIGVVLVSLPSFLPMADGDARRCFLLAADIANTPHAACRCSPPLAGRRPYRLRGITRPRSWPVRFFVAYTI